MEHLDNEVLSFCLFLVKSEGGKVSVKVIAGESMGKNAVIDTKTPIIYLHFTIQPGGKVTQRVPKNYNTFAYVANGEALFGAEQKTAKKEQAVFFEKDGDEVLIIGVFVSITAFFPIDSPSITLTDTLPSSIFSVTP